MVGVAPGAPKITEKEFAAVGADYHKRGRITDDYLRAARKLWTESMSSYQGEFISFKDVEMFPKPIQKPYPPILIGGGEKGLSEVALRRVVELGDGWIPAYLTETELEQGRKSIEKRKKEVGKMDEEFTVGLEMFTGLSESDASAGSIYSATLLKNFASMDEGLKRSLVGSTKTVISRLEGYRRVGLDYVELKFMYKTIAEFHEMMRAFAGDILPSFKN